MSDNQFGTRRSFETGSGSADLYRLDQLEKDGVGSVSKLPFSIKILLEQVLRNLDNFQVNEKDIKALANWDGSKQEQEIPFKPSRVLLQDFTGVPAVVDLAALRSSVVEMGGDPAVINPRVPVDLVVDHSLQVDQFGTKEALQNNMEIEFKRNKERYEFLKWGAYAFKNFRVVPPGVGIIHQVNLEYLANVVQQREGVCFPDTVVGTDSHTTMVNGAGVLGWGVGGIEAEAAMLGQPIYMLIPQVIGFKLHGSLQAGTTATDLVLRVVEILREKGVVEKFVEFYGAGLSSLSLADRATLANMAPEYGATMGFFPADAETLKYLRGTGRSEEVIQRVERYTKEQGLFRTDETPDPLYTDTLELDLATVEPALAGPKRPQDRIALSDMKFAWHKTMQAPIKARGFELDEVYIQAKSPIPWEKGGELKQGSVVIAAITSCTNTSNPSVLIAAGLLAKKAAERGLIAKPWVKTSLAPGSRVVTDYLNKAGLTEPLETLGFYTVGYGCTTCIGNTGPLEDPIVEAIYEKDLVVAAVLSGNRNFEGRISPHVKANYLASPPLVVAYAIAGTVDVDLSNDPIGVDQNGVEVKLADIWPSPEEIAETSQWITPEMYRERYQGVQDSSEMWNRIESKTQDVYEWEEASTYIQNPPFFKGMSLELPPIGDITAATTLIKLGDSVTTDHISPAGAFAPEHPAGQYLMEKGVERKDFNSYGARRGNDRVMTRGTFANVRIRNQMVPGVEGGYTIHLPTNEQMSVYDAAMKYQAAGIPLIVLGGSEYGTGSSRDWAAKGSFLLGVKAVLVSSFERIHRSNLIGMGVLPLQFQEGKSADDYGLTGKEKFSVVGICEDIKPLQALKVIADGQEIPVICRLDTMVEIEYYKNGGILHTVLRNFLKEGQGTSA